MASKAIYGRDFEIELDQGLAPEQFKYRFLVEGDSWMDRSSLAQASLPLALAKAFDDAGESALFINLSMFGHTMRRISESLNDEFLQWITTPFGWKFDALLFSAGGNDFIDAARDPDPGQGILRLITQSERRRRLPTDCFRPDAVGTLVTEFLDPNFAKLYDTVRAQPPRRHPDLPEQLRHPDRAQRAGRVPGARPGCSRPTPRTARRPTLWQEVTERIFIDVEATVEGWTAGPRLDFPGAHRRHAGTGRRGDDRQQRRLAQRDPSQPGRMGQAGAGVAPRNQAGAAAVTQWRPPLDAAAPSFSPAGPR